jgi:O-antigen/teichoic acid export membrane protein
MTPALAAVEEPTLQNRVNQEPSRPRFIANMATVLTGQIACAAVALVIEICYARLLGPTGRGQVTLAMMVIAFAVLLGAVGGSIPITTWSAGSKERFPELFPSVLFCGLIGCIAAGVLWEVTYWKWHPAFLQGVTPGLAVLILLTIPVAVIFDYLIALVTGTERFRLRAGISFVEQITGLLGLVVLVLAFGRTAEMAMLANLLSFAVVAAVTAYALRKVLPPVWNLTAIRKNFREALSFGLRGQFGGLATFFNYRLDVFIVNYFLGPAQVGLYAVGVAVSESLWQIPQAAALAIFPRTARTIDQGAGQFTCLVTRHVLLISCVSAAILATLSAWIIPMLFGSRFSASVQVIWWILPGTVANAAGKVMSADLSGRGKPEYNSNLAVIALIVTAALDFALIPWMGINGAALASSIAYFAQSFMLAITIRRQLNVGWKPLLLVSKAELAAYKQTWQLYKVVLWPDPARSGGRR